MGKDDALEYMRQMLVISTIRSLKDKMLKIDESVLGDWIREGFTGIDNLTFEEIEEFYRDDSYCQNWGMTLTALGLGEN